MICVIFFENVELHKISVTSGSPILRFLKCTFTGLIKILTIDLIISARQDIGQEEIVKERKKLLQKMKINEK